MKNTIKTAIILTLALTMTLFISSCDKKTNVTDHMSAMVKMTYAPNPATVNTPIEMTFSVMEDSIPKDVTNISCEMKFGSTMLDPMVITKLSTGMYMGTYTFKNAGKYTIDFNYNHDGAMNMEELTIDVK